ncbi:hypothetical protein HBB16_04500 [Pseudonocardia sp. MCCB 268]|nr:hypothetical protein [Pseudonocardia cytotoxica]
MTRDVGGHRHPLRFFDPTGQVPSGASLWPRSAPLSQRITDRQEWFGDTHRMRWCSRPRSQAPGPVSGSRAGAGEVADDPTTGRSRRRSGTWESRSRRRDVGGRVCGRRGGRLAGRACWFCGIGDE